MAEMKNPGVSIVIVNFNTREYIFDLLDSIRRFTKYEPLETIVIDNCSTDGSREELDVYNGITYFKAKFNAGHGPGIHRGILASGYDYVLLLDADTVILKAGLIERLVGVMDRDKTFAAGVPQLLNSYGLWVHITGPKSLTDYLRSSVSVINRHEFNSIHPFCCLINRRMYIERIDRNFIAHGAPGVEVYYEINIRNKRNGEGIELAEVQDVKEYVYHYWAGSRSKTGAYMGKRKLQKVKGAPFLADIDCALKHAVREIFTRFQLHDIIVEAILRNRK
jgi:glycosyltransferase involved in cell wall biosynthesis